MGIILVFGVVFFYLWRLYIVATLFNKSNGKEIINSKYESKKIHTEERFVKRYSIKSNISE